MQNVGCASTAQNFVRFPYCTQNKSPLSHTCPPPPKKRKFVPWNWIFSVGTVQCMCQTPAVIFFVIFIFWGGEGRRFFRTYVLQRRTHLFTRLCVLIRIPQHNSYKITAYPVRSSPLLAIFAVCLSLPRIRLLFKNGARKLQPRHISFSRHGVNAAPA